MDVPEQGNHNIRVFEMSNVEKHRHELYVKMK